MLFAGNGDHDTRSLLILWDTGHIFAFWIWCHLILTRWPPLAKRSFWQQFLICIAFSLLASLAIEYSQDAMGRDFSVYDIRKNLVGCMAALIITVPTRKRISGAIRLGLQIVICLALLFELLPLGRAIIDDIIAFRQFPTLCSFDTPFERDRWIGKAQFAIDRNIKKDGRASLKVMPHRGRRTQATLLYLARDWTGFRYLELDVYNPLPTVIHFNLGVYDDIYYQNGYRKGDRYLRYFKLSQGWNHIRIPIEDIRYAPEGHEMHMAYIKEITMRAWQNDNPSVIYIDSIILSLT